MFFLSLSSVLCFRAKCGKWGPDTQKSSPKASWAHLLQQPAKGKKGGRSPLIFGGKVFRDGWRRSVGRKGQIGGAKRGGQTKQETSSCCLLNAAKLFLLLIQFP